MTKILNRKTLLSACWIIPAALILAIGLEWVMLGTLPPIFTDTAVEVPGDPGLLERSVPYLHSSGRTALKEEWNALRLAFAFFLQLAVLTVLFPLGVGKRLRTGLAQGLRNMLRSLREEKKKNLKRLLFFFAAFIAVFLISRVWIWDVYHRNHWMAVAVCVWAGIAAGILAAFHDALGRKPEVFFLILTLIFGGMLSFFLQDATGISLDDGYHFQNALNYSTLGHVRYTAAEWDVMQEDNPREYNLEKWKTVLEEQDRKYQAGAVYVTTGFHLNPKEGWMAAHGLGLFLGRLLHLRFFDIWSLGRFTGLLAYALVGYFAIRRIKSGKMILTMVLMLPSCVFLAANYSYDPCVISGIALSCSYWVAQWQESDQRLKWKDVAVMLGGMLIACFVKAIYFPVFLLFLFMPEKKFDNRKQRRGYRALILLAMALVMLYILLPLGQSGGEGDNRAEGNINTLEQIRYVLTNPLDYLNTLWHFLQSFLDPNRMHGVVCSYGYQGGGDNTVLVLILLAVVTFTDASPENQQPYPGVKIFGGALLLGALALMSTSMYAWFTEVGASEIDGMQDRYLIPFLYPAMALLGSGKARYRGKKELYNGLFLALMFFAGVSGMMATLVEYYN